MSKLIAKIINEKTVFVQECSYFKSIVRSSRNDGCIDLYNIMRLVHLILMDQSVECNIPYQKNSFSLTDNVDNILTYVDIEYLRGRPFIVCSSCHQPQRLNVPYSMNLFHPTPPLLCYNCIHIGDLQSPYTQAGRSKQRFLCLIGTVPKRAASQIFYVNIGQNIVNIIS